MGDVDRMGEGSMRDTAKQLRFKSGYLVRVVNIIEDIVSEKRT